MKIKLEELRAITEKLFQHLEEQGGQVIEIPVDYYWNIPKQQVYNPYERPSQLDLGQLTDDWNELQKHLRSNEEPLNYYLVWLAAILRAIGENIVA